MIEQLPTFQHLLKILQRVPYLASKNLYRVATHFLDMSPQQIEQFCRALQLAHERLTKCSVCCAWQEKGQSCLFCANTKRDNNLICVVETWQELLAIEKTGGYKGMYHVLGGAISPLEGIGPEHLSIKLLVARASSVREIILAMNQTPEAEATSSYIAHQLKSCSVTLSVLAQGVPVGSSLAYIDRLTVYKALADRRPF